MSRKYGHRGYMDDDREKRPERQPQRPREDRFAPSKPKGRGLGAPTREVFTCAVCGAAQDPPGLDQIDAACAHCATDLHSCTHCTHFLTGVRFECRQPIVERISSKSRRNECTLFRPKVAVEFAAEAPAEPSDPQSTFDALFKNL